jgi:hypothetical protein
VLVLVLVLVLEPCCLQKRRVNPIRSAFPELHARSGLEMRPEGARECGSSLRYESGVSRRSVSNLVPLQGTSLQTINAGLKPWAKLSCPFRTQTNNPLLHHSVRALRGRERVRLRDTPLTTSDTSHMHPCNRGQDEGMLPVEFRQC